MGIILRRNGLTSQGVIVYPSIIDGDNKVEIKIMAYMKREMQINVRDRISQIFLIPYLRGKATQVQRTGVVRRTRKFVFWKTVVNDQRPKLYNHTNE
jgi:dUTPase